jgi:NitT/TauT family transport system ATP-binding protein
MANVQTVPGPALRLSHVHKKFDRGAVALDDLSLAVEPGEFVSVVGPSGCGKSTLLRIIAGLTRATSGDISCDTADIGFVFQDATLLPWRTVRRNVELPAELRGLSRVERRHRATDAIAMVGLEEFAGYRPRELSGGMKMRVSLARALTMSPSLFLFDEPFGALDAITRERLGDELQGLYAARRFAAVFVTHAVSEAVFLSSRVLVMAGRGGRFVADVAVPWGFPRPAELRYAPDAVAIVSQIQGHLRQVSENAGPDVVSS